MIAIWGHKILFRKQYERACSDLEKGFNLDKDHKNAKLYLIQTLFQWAKQISLEAKNKMDLEKSQAELLNKIFFSQILMCSVWAFYDCSSKIPLRNSDLV